jgi:hypothetical protein
MLALTIGGCSNDGGEKSRTVTAVGENPVRLFTPAGSGVTVRYPRGWTASTRNDSVVPNPALCFVLRRPRDVELKLVEYLPPALQRGELRGPDAYPVKPPHFRYEMLEPTDVAWTSGRILDFQARHRVFYVGVEVPARPDPQIKRTVERILDTIHAGPGRCRPTSGVGSRQYYAKLKRAASSGR